MTPIADDGTPVKKKRQGAELCPRATHDCDGATEVITNESTGAAPRALGWRFDVVAGILLVSDGGEFAKPAAPRFLRALSRLR
jgi:hypothetical protein